MEPSDSLTSGLGLLQALKCDDLDLDDTLSCGKVQALLLQDSYCTFCPSSPSDCDELAEVSVSSKPFHNKNLLTRIAKDLGLASNGADAAGALIVQYQKLKLRKDYHALRLEPSGDVENKTEL